MPPNLIRPGYESCRDLRKEEEGDRRADSHADTAAPLFLSKSANCKFQDICNRVKRNWSNFRDFYGGRAKLICGYE